MKHNFDTYRLYSDEKIFAHSVRVKVKMKDEVDIDVLRHAANAAIKSWERMEDMILYPITMR